MLSCTPGVCKVPSLSPWLPLDLVGLPVRIGSVLLSYRGYLEVRNMASTSVEELLDDGCTTITHRRRRVIEHLRYCKLR